MSQPKKLNDAQLRLLRWVSDGAPGEASNGDRVSARALEHRGLVRVKGRGPTWHATITDAGRFYLQHGRVTPGLGSASVPPVAPVDNDWKVDSPRGRREAGGKPRGDELFSGDRHDPFDEKVLITVKEAAWMLSLPEGAIRQAAINHDIDRVFIGEGTTNYRIVYGSLLAWVNDMPREGPARSWWR